MNLIAQLAKGYFVNVYDYNRESSGLLVSSGAGTMMSVMDACPVFRWCLDIDQNRDADLLARFLICADLSVNPLAVAGWFSITPPDALQSASRRLVNLGRVLCYTQGAIMPGGFHFDTLDAFIAGANNFAALTAEIKVDKLCIENRFAGGTGVSVAPTRESVRVSQHEKHPVSDIEKDLLRPHRERDQASGISSAHALLAKAPASAPLR